MLIVQPSSEGTDIYTTSLHDVFQEQESSVDEAEPAGPGSVQC